MNRVYTYRIENLSKAHYKRLDKFFVHLTWLYNQGVEYCRAQYASGEKTPSYYDLCKWLTGKRGEDDRTGRWNVSCQRSVLNRVRKGYEKFFRDHKGLPRFKSFDRGVRSFETEAAKPRRHPKSDRHYVHIKGIGRLSFTDTRGVLDTTTVKIVRIVRNAIRYEVQLICEVDEGLKVVDKRDALGIDLGVESPVTLSNGVQYEPFQGDDTRRKRLQRKVSRSKRFENEDGKKVDGENRSKKKRTLARESHRIKVRRRTVRTA